MPEIRPINSPDEKSFICDTVLRSLPSWFGIESSIIEYVNTVTAMPFWAVYDNDVAIGFVALKIHTPFAAEVCVMGITEPYHRRGLGRKLIECCEDYCIEHGYEYLTVKTVADSAPSKSYAKTRRFYTSVGFRPLEVFPLLWDEHNPCLFMVKHLTMD